MSLVSQGCLWRSLPSWLTREIGAVDVFGKRFQKELEQFKKDAAKWQAAAAEAQLASQDGLLVAAAAGGGGSGRRAGAGEVVSGEGTQQLAAAGFVACREG